MTELIDRLRASKLKAYEADPGLIKEHFGIEEGVLAGGYSYRQVLELVQNGADAILEAREAGAERNGPRRIEVVLDASCLYVANTGAAFSEEGIDAVLRSHSSPKRGNQIGRFGLGFKSLLRLEGKIDVVSGPAAFGFDPDRCRKELRERFRVKDAPGLRLAWARDDTQAAALRERFSWATTVVCAEIRAEGLLDRLRTEIQKFPSEFLLFLPVPVTLTLDDGADAKRELHRKPDGEDQLLLDGESTSRWRVMEKMVSITDQRAKDDATHIHTRDSDSVPLSWAVPLDAKRDEAGRFWAFFPTQTETRLPGILNAPWKLNSDRNAIIGGEWNTALMQEAARLIVEMLPRLSTKEDSGRPLDAFPRQLDRKDEDAAPLVEAIWAALEKAAVVPDAAGTLRAGRDLWRHPRENAELARQWQTLADADGLAKVVHPSCMERQRGSRLKALAERIERQAVGGLSCPSLRTQEASSWFAAVASAKVETAIQVLKLAEAYANDCTQAEWRGVQPSLAIIPSQAGQLLTANKVVFAPEGTSIPDGRSPVAPMLCDDAEARRILEGVMGVKPLDDSVWEAVLRESLNNIRSYPQAEYDKGWRAFWAKLRMAPETVRRQFATQNKTRIRVRRRDGAWVSADAALLPGELVSLNDAPPNQNMLVDPGAHGKDEALLMAIDVCRFPDGTIGPDDYSKVVGEYGGLSEWLDYWQRHYLENVSSRPYSNYLKASGLTLPKGWAFLPQLSGTPNAKLAKRFLERISSDKFVGQLKFGHSTPSYPKIDVPHPLSWFLLKHAMVQVGEDTVALSAMVDRRHEPALAKLANWEQLQPGIERLEGATPSVVATDAEVGALWLALVKTLAIPSALADDSLHDLWAGAARDGVIPETLRSEAGEVPLSQVFVTGSPDLARRARTPSRIVVTLDESALALWQSKGARSLSELLKHEWTSVSGPVDLLVSIVPELADVLLPQAGEVARCQPVSGLKLRIAEASDPVSCLMWENTLLVDAEQLAQLSRAERLKVLVGEVAAAGWLACEPAEALQRLGDARVDERRAEVARGASLPERLLLAVGRRAEPLRTALGGLGSMDFLQECTPLQLAELTLAQLGPATLSVLKDTLAEEGLKPPSRWNTASTEARAFVAGIGFPEEFATSPEARRESEESISGPIELPLLHDFQVEVLEGIRVLVASGTVRRRAVVSLPTGAGKTRVMVEAAVLLVLKPEGYGRSVLWVAQTDELCEQAVQAFRQVWINLGAQRTDLRIVRLWGGNRNPAPREPSKPVVVVTSIQTLNNRMGTEGLAWLQSPRLVVVDECHHAIMPSYTNLLRWLDAETPKPGAPGKDEPPIIGLSATPFRTDDEESQRLAKRFDSRWFPADQERLHARLRSEGVLAKVDYEALQSGIGLLEEEIKQLSQLPEPWEGLNFENLLEAINQRLGGDKQRNQCLVERIQRAEERSILFFANSVQHAEEMSARLNLAGISAAAISGSTPAVSRRYFLDRFQRGEIRILCNHTVLSTGFDAPKTDMVLIARQVFSAVRYMQMVGRGMRGEKNGGTARCRLVTVVDNLGRFQDKHPYHFCAKYFSGD